jgi:hypothetical protein
MTDAKRRAQDGLAEMVDEALATMRQSISGKMMQVRGSTRTSDARFVLAAVLEMEQRSEKAESEATRPIQSIGDLAQMSERIRLLKQNERRGA